MVKSLSFSLFAIFNENKSPVSNKKSNAIAMYTMKHKILYL